MFAKRDKHYPSRSGQTSLATAETNFTKPITKINSGPSKVCKHCEAIWEMGCSQNHKIMRKPYLNGTPLQSRGLFKIKNVPLTY